jgi:hypothetical protein
MDFLIAEHSTRQVAQPAFMGLRKERGGRANRGRSPGWAAPILLWTPSGGSRVTLAGPAPAARGQF